MALHYMVSLVSNRRSSRNPPSKAHVRGTCLLMLGYIFLFFVDSPIESENESKQGEHWAAQGSVFPPSLTSSRMNESSKPISHTHTLSLSPMVHSLVPLLALQAAVLRDVPVQQGVHIGLFDVSPNRVHEPFLSLYPTYGGLSLVSLSQPVFSFCI